MLDDYGVAEPLNVFGEVFFDPGVCVLSEGEKAETANHDSHSGNRIYLIEWENFL